MPGAIDAVTCVTSADGRADAVRERCVVQPLHAGTGKGWGVRRHYDELYQHNDPAGACVPPSAKAPRRLGEEIKGRVETETESEERNAGGKGEEMRESHSSRGHRRR